MDPPGPTQPTQATSGRSLVTFKSPWSFGTEVPKATTRRKQVGDLPSCRGMSEAPSGLQTTFEVAGRTLHTP